MNKKELLETAIETVAGRGKSYGTPEDNFSRISRYWNVYLTNRYGSGHTVLDEIDVARMMDHVKNARLDNDPYHMDSWIDKAGYAACGGEIASKNADKS